MGTFLKNCPHTPKKLLIAWCVRSRRKFTLLNYSHIVNKMATHTPVGTHFVSPHLYVCYINGRMVSSPTDTNCFDNKMATNNLRRGALRAPVSKFKLTFIQTKFKIKIHGYAQPK